MRWEYRYKPQDDPVDYALFVAGSPRLFVEAKSLGRDVGDHRWRMQTVNYANAAGVDWCVLTDGNFWQIYRSNASGDLDSKLFLSTCLHSQDGSAPAYEPASVLLLISKEKLPENKIETLWTRLNVDRRGTQALQDSVREKDASRIGVVRKRSGLTKNEVLGFLDRVRITTGISGSDPLLADAAKPPPETSTRPAHPDSGPVAPKLPTQHELEVPLLRAILKRGGEIKMRNQGEEIDNELADAFQLTDAQRTAHLANRTETVWSNRIRWTRMALVKKGDLDGSRRGIWALTEQGRKRAGD